MSILDNKYEPLHYRDIYHEIVIKFCTSKLVTQNGSEAQYMLHARIITDNKEILWDDGLDLPVSDDLLEVLASFLCRQFGAQCCTVMPITTSAPDKMCNDCYVAVFPGGHYEESLVETALIRMYKKAL